MPNTRDIITEVRKTFKKSHFCHDVSVKGGLAPNDANYWHRKKKLLKQKVSFRDVTKKDLLRSCLVMSVNVVVNVIDD